MMRRVGRLLFGSFVASCVFGFGLWINTQVNLNVREIIATPSKIEISNIEAARDYVVVERADLKEYIRRQPVSLSNHSYVWVKPDTKLVPSMESLVLNELNKYGPEYLKKVGLREIVLVGGLKNKANAPVLGFTDPHMGTIYLNTLVVEGSRSRAVVAEQTVHHEIAHLLSYELYGYNFDRDGAWSKAADGFEYGKQDYSMSEYFPSDGFVSRYSMYSPAEDFAEVYSLIYTEQFTDVLQDEAQKSDVLKSKVGFVFESIQALSLDQCRQSPQILSNACDQ